MTRIEIISLISPFVSAILAAWLTYRFTINSKKFDILYENKIPAFKEIASKINDFKNFCIGRVAYFDGNEYSTFYEEGLGTLMHRDEIANSLSFNSIFLSKPSRLAVTSLLNNMSGLCNAEASIAGGNNDLNPKDAYQKMAETSEILIEALYKELNLT